MTAGGEPLVILLDKGTPILTANPFLDREHKVIYHSDVLVSGAKDELVVATAILNKAALIAVDLDMKRMARRFGSPNNEEKYRSLNLIFVSCNETLAAKRLVGGRRHFVSRSLVMNRRHYVHDWRLSLTRVGLDFGSIDAIK